jgi:heterodisulfide reductase subunit B
MSYIYYPGCSLKSTGQAYEESMLSVFSTLGVTIDELNDWNCCGATAYMSTSELKAFALSARNFALAEKQGDGKSIVNLVIPCAACYLVLNKAYHYIHDYSDIRSKIHKALDEADLQYSGKIKIRHPLDILVKDIGLDKSTSCVKVPLTGLRVACYYGCQIIRPFAEFDNLHEPCTMENMMRSIGAQAIDWPLKTRCCGGSLTGTIPEVGLRLSYILLKEAKKQGCDVIATACPLCQFNLECYQMKMKSKFEETIKMPVVYFTQLIGIALGVSYKNLGLKRLFVSLAPTLRKKLNSKEGVLF